MAMLQMLERLCRRTRALKVAVDHWMKPALVHLG